MPDSTPNPLLTQINLLASDLLVQLQFTVKNTMRMRKKAKIKAKAEQEDLSKFMEKSDSLKVAEAQYTLLLALANVIEAKTKKKIDHRSINESTKLLFSLSRTENPAKAYVDRCVANLEDLQAVHFFVNYPE